MSASTSFPLTGAACIAQLEMEHLLSQHLAICSNCSQLDPVKTPRRCTGCRLAVYCSKGCQQQHWPRHRTFCNLVQGKGKKNAYLSREMQEDCFRKIIDSYRIRVDNDHQYRQEDHGIHFSGILTNDLVWAKGDVYADFQLYLDLIEDAHIVSDKWTFEDRMECLALAVDRSHPDNIFVRLNQERILMDNKGDTTILNALLILAEHTVGYEGKGSPADNTWYNEFQKALDTHAETQAQLIADTVNAVKTALRSH